MDVVRFGLGFRALRRRRGLTQAELARRAGVSRGVVWRIERGRADRVTVRTMNRLAAELDGRIDVRLLWHGEGLDRLLDGAHAALVNAVISFLETHGWTCRTELTFNLGGERGSIDVLAYHPATRSILVIEVKSVVPDVQGTLAPLDRKVRVAPEVARRHGWPAGTVSRLLVVPSDRNTYRRIATHAAIFGAALPARSWAVRTFLRRPIGSLNGILFLPSAPQQSHRRRRPGAPPAEQRLPRSRHGDPGSQS